MSVLRTSWLASRWALLREGDTVGALMAHEIFINLLRMRYARVHAYRCVLKMRIRCFIQGRIAAEFASVVLPDVPR